MGNFRTSASLLFRDVAVTFDSKSTVVKKLYSYSLVITLLLGLAACSGSNRMYKQGQELEEAGMYAEAATMYMDALRRDNENVEALIALKDVGQRVLDDRYGAFFRAVQGGDDKEAIQKYQSAENFRNQLASYNIQLERPAGHEDDYNAAVSRYVAVKYQEARGLLGAEDFDGAEAILSEIQALDPDYRDASDLLRLSQARPLYDEAVAEFDQRHYRPAYRLFKQLEDAHGPFEESEQYRERALRNGQFGLGLVNFINHTREGGVEALLSSRIVNILQGKNDPFLRLIDRTMVDQLTEEQIRSMSGGTDVATAAQAGQLLGAKAILVGEVVRMDVQRGEVRRQRMPGYLGTRVTRRNEKGERETHMTYRKVWYYNIQQSNRVSAVLQYKLVNVETGEIIRTDAVNITQEDEVSFSEYSGNTRYLYMGEWKEINRDFSTDRILNDASSKRQLDRQLEANRQLRDINEMKEAVYNAVATRAAEDIYNAYLSIEG